MPAKIGMFLTFTNRNTTTQFTKSTAQPNTTAHFTKSTAQNQVIQKASLVKQSSIPYSMRSIILRPNTGCSSCGH